MTLSELEGLMPILTAPGAPDFRLPPLEVRELFATMLAGLPVPEDLTFEAATVGGVSGLWSGPAAAESSRVVLYLHGGGYVGGSAEGYRVLAGLIASAAGGRAFLPDYRLAPEHAYPAALDDAVAAYVGLLEQGHQPQSITIAGDSAGGGLAAATLRGERLIQFDDVDIRPRATRRGERLVRRLDRRDREVIGVDTVSRSARDSRERLTIEETRLHPGLAGPRPESRQHPRGSAGHRPSSGRVRRADHWSRRS